jgi:hypothetical protein
VDGLTDVIKLKVNFCNFVTAIKNQFFSAVYRIYIIPQLPEIKLLDPNEICGLCNVIPIIFTKSNF